MLSTGLSRRIAENDLAQAPAPQLPPGVGDWIIPALAGVGVALLIWIGWRIWTRKRRDGFPPPPESSCGKCGYNVSGLPTFTCPECGSDLREVGIQRKQDTSSARRTAVRDTARLVGVLVIWTLIYALLYAIVGTGSYPLQPWDTANRPAIYGWVDGHFWPYQGKSTHTVALEPFSEAYRRIVVTEQREVRFQGWRNASEVRWTGDSPNVGLTHFSLSLQLDTLAGKTATMEIDPNTFAWKYEDPTKPGTFQSGPTLDADILLIWMRVNGVDQPSELPKDEANMLFDLLSRTRQQGTVGSTAAPWAVGRLERIVAQQKALITNPMFAYPFKGSRGTAADTYGPAWSIYWLSIPFGLGIYSYGTNWIWSRYRRRSRKDGGRPGDRSTSGNDPAGWPASPREAANKPANNLARGAGGPANGEQRRRSRTLTILFTDLKDYTQRTADSSRDGLRAVIAKNREIVEGVVSATEGSIVKTIGDAYLITFESATDAVLAALAIQRAAARYNAAVGEADLLQYRIAVCTGEVTLERGDVFGTPVNVAARVQALAEPGMVYFTESTLHAINAAEIRCVEVGPRELKGIATPVRVFQAQAME